MTTVFVREILRTLRVDLVGGLCIPIFDLLHGSLRILGLVLHRLDARETEERGERAIGLRIPACTFHSVGE